MPLHFTIDDRNIVVSQVLKPRPGCESVGHRRPEVAIAVMFYAERVLAPDATTVSIVGDPRTSDADIAIDPRRYQGLLVVRADKHARAFCIDVVSDNAIQLRAL